MRTKFDIYVLLLSLVPTSAGRLLVRPLLVVPDHPPSSHVSLDTCILYRHLQFVDNVIIIKAKIHLPQVTLVDFD